MVANEVKNNRKGIFQSEVLSTAEGQCWQRGQELIQKGEHIGSQIKETVKSIKSLNRLGFLSTSGLEPGFARVALIASPANESQPDKPSGKEMLPPNISWYGGADSAREGARSLFREDACLWWIWIKGNLAPVSLSFSPGQRGHEICKGSTLRPLSLCSRRVQNV